MTLGSPFEEGLGEKWDFSLVVRYTLLELTEVFTRAYQVCKFFKANLNALKFIFSMIPKCFP